MPALTESLRFTIRETGLTRGIGDWLKVNKKDGFDCQSCAWPSPDDHRQATASDLIGGDHDTATYFPEGNVLVPINSTADRSNTPTSKSLVISVKPSSDAAGAIDELLRDAKAAAR